MFSFCIEGGLKIDRVTGEDTKFICSLALLWPADGRNFLIATDGKIAAAVEVQANNLEPRLIPPACCDCTGERIEVSESDGEFTVRPKPGRPFVEELPDDIEGKFPPVGAVFPFLGGDVVAFTVDAKRLSRLADAISGDDMVTFFIPRRPDKGLQVLDKPFVMVGRGENGAMKGLGVQMTIGDGKELECLEYAKKIIPLLPKKSIEFGEKK